SKSAWRILCLSSMDGHRRPSPLREVDVRLGIRTIPWLIAAAALGVPLLAGGLAGWPYVLVWGILLVMLWIVTRDRPASRHERMVLPAFLLPVLFLLGFVGGWYLIPADIAWMVVEFADRRGTDGVPRIAAS
ncbi:MAG: hypothetical protein P4L30_01830, partial [Candidatus Limnocylindrales bacterium]|nr:hypothetical protein [Candidatus Limnocylindrales bacterium]